MRLLVNAALLIERGRFPGVDRYERTETRQGRVKGIKENTVTKRMGKITFFGAPGSRGDFYPPSLKKGVRSERAPKLSQRNSRYGRLISVSGLHHQEAMRCWIAALYGKTNPPYYNSQ